VLKIRLQRYGRKNRPNYRVVVAEHSAPIQGKYIDLIGRFDPLIEKHGFVVDVDKIKEWIKKGAKPTNTVARLLKGQGVDGMDVYITEMKDRKVKNPKEVAEAPVVEALATEKVEESKVDVSQDKTNDSSPKGSLSDSEAKKSEDGTEENKSTDESEESSKEEEKKEESPVKEEVKEGIKEEVKEEEAKEESA